MSKILLKIIASLTGAGVLIYLLGRKITFWEIEAVNKLKEKQSAPKQPAPSVAEVSKSSKQDDLKRIKGVGPVIEGKLNEMGYYSFQQIAALSPPEIDHIEDKINFQGRIEREQWIEQARKLLSE